MKKQTSKPGSETIGAVGEKSKMTLFRDDRQEDIGAIVVAIVTVVIVMLLTV